MADVEIVFYKNFVHTGWKGTSLPNRCWYQKTRVFLLPHSEDRVILRSFVWIGYQRVTDGRTDGQTDGRTDGRTNGIAVGITALCIACNAAAL